ncbi:hypothetical protein GCM10010431_65590 [Streptomyces kunmingensis]
MEPSGLTLPFAYRAVTETVSESVTGFRSGWPTVALTRVGRASEALELARAAWTVMENSGSSQYLARIMMAWGQAAEASDDLATAQDRLLRAHAYFTDAGVPDLQPIQGALRRVNARLEAQQQ